MDKCIKIHTDGFLELIDYPTNNIKPSLATMYKAIECQMIDIHQIVDGPDFLRAFDLVFDEEFLFSNEHPTINKIGSYLNGYMQGYDPLCGNVLIVKRDENPDGYSLIGMTEEEAKQILKELENIRVAVQNLELSLSTPHIQITTSI